MKNSFKANRGGSINFRKEVFIYKLGCTSAMYVLYIRKVETGNHLGVWDGLIQFTLILMGKIDSVFKQITSRTAFWKELSSRNEVPLYSEKLCPMI